jgi:hypothetical protein
MNKGTLIRLLVCLFVLSFFLYSYIDEQNGLTQLRLELPAIAKEIKIIREENRHLVYAIERFENPQHLLELARLPEFSHLKHPLVKEILTCQKGIALSVPASEEKNAMTLAHPQPGLMVGAAP